MMTLDEALPLLQTGDVLLCVGADNDAVAMGIRAVTHSEYHHAGVIRLDYDFHMVYEATGKGFGDCHIQAWKGRRYQKVSVFRVKEGLPTNDTAATMMMLSLKGQGYGFGQIGAIWFHSAFPHLTNMNTDFAEKITCSEGVSAVLTAFLFGVDPCPDKPDAYTTPGDLAKSPALVHVLDFVI